MTSIRRLAVGLLLLLLVAGCGIDDLTLPAFAAQPPGFAQAPDFANPPLPLGSPMVLTAQPAPQINDDVPVFVPGIGVIYIDP